MQLPRIVLAAVVAATASIATASASNIHPMIVGGEPVPAGAKTYVVGLRETADDSSNCGGSLITPTHVLTAAHCASHGRYKFAAVGTHFLAGHADGERIAITKSVVHPKYDYTTLAYDVAVLTLATPATRASPVALQSGAVDTIAGEKAMAMGWGQISDEADQSEELLRVEMKIWSAADCAGAKLSRAPDATMLCAGGKNWKDICKGDSGGPLVRETKARDVVAGVTSWSNGCGVKGRPSVFAQVAAAADFIRKNAPNATFV